jgi:hypothetical protein
MKVKQHPRGHTYAESGMRVGGAAVATVSPWTGGAGALGGSTAEGTVGVACRSAGDALMLAGPEYKKNKQRHYVQASHVRGSEARAQRCTPMPIWC